VADDFESHRPPDNDLSFWGDRDHEPDLALGRGEPAVRASELDESLFPAELATPSPAPLPDPPTPTPHPIPQAPSTPYFPAWRAPAREVPTTPIPQGGRVLTYETFYGLREKPFGSGSDSRFSYHSAAHDRAAQELLVSIRRRDRLAILTGDVGTGKTMLCRALHDRIDRRTFTSFATDPFVTLEDLLKAILIDFGVISRADVGGDRLAAATREELTVALHEFLLSLVQINGFAVVFVDDAQTLSPEMIAQVQGIADTNQALVGIVLIGQPELLRKIGPQKLTSGAGRVSVHARLDPLAKDEIAGYVVHRLAVGGAGPSRIEFNDAALALVYEVSRGVPQLVNLVCERALARGFEDSASLIDAPLVASAARDLDLPAPEPGRQKAMNRLLTAVALVGLVLIGAAVFRAQLTRAIASWTARPAPSGSPRGTGGPLETRPSPSDGRPTR
jgi:general secretion pathway protein A